jgi:uncharacterized membrane protein YbhN (UPF0104 family)
MRRRIVKILGSLFGLFLFAFAVWVLYHELKEYHYHEVVREIKALSIPHLFLGLGLTVLSYFIMTGYDLLAFRYIGYRLSYPKVAMISFISYAFSNNLGFSLLAGSSVRYRLYSAWGLSAEAITKIVAFCTLTVWLGFLTLAGVALLLNPLIASKALHLPFLSVRPLGIIFLFLVGGYFLWSVLRKKPLRIRSWEFPLPSLQVFLAQVGGASLDWAVAGSVLYALLPGTASLTYLEFIALYLLAQLAGLVSQVPGGLGVFEALILVLLSPKLPVPAILSSLLVYRLMYYVAPLTAAAISFGIHELLRHKRNKKDPNSLKG